MKKFLFFWWVTVFSGLFAHHEYHEYTVYVNAAQDKELVRGLANAGNSYAITHMERFYLQQCNTVIKRYLVDSERVAEMKKLSFLGNPFAAKYVHAYNSYSKVLYASHEEENLVENMRVLAHAGNFFAKKYIAEYDAYMSATSTEAMEMLACDGNRFASHWLAGE